MKDVNPADSNSTDTPVSDNERRHGETYDKSNQEAVDTVCCGCRPKAKHNKRRKFHKITDSLRTVARLATGRSLFYDAAQGRPSDFADDDDDNLFFFDAEENPLGDDEYPIVFTTNLQHPKPLVTFEHPESLLRGAIPVEMKHEERDEKKAYRRAQSVPIESHKTPSQRLLQIARRPTDETTMLLEKPRVKIDSRGYPGELTVVELAECVSSFFICFL